VLFWGLAPALSSVPDRVRGQIIGRLCVEFRSEALGTQMLPSFSTRSDDAQQAIRADYTDHLRRQESKVRGGRGFGRFVRGVQTAQRDSARRDLAKKLEALEKNRRQVDAMIAAVDKGVVQIESYLLKNP
jgi:hypothetical protein